MIFSIPIFKKEELVFLTPAVRDTLILNVKLQNYSEQFMTKTQNRF
jgi:hypothetical protein